MNPINKMFITSRAPELLQSLSEDSPALWGVMTAQHMLEHLGMLFHISRENKLPCLVPENKLQASVDFLMSDRPMRKNIRIPNVPLEAGELRYDDMQHAYEKLMGKIEGFYTYYRENPESTAMHPFFGQLGMDQWEQFHAKHLYHHLAQFDQLPEVDHISIEAVLA
ncbi:MAG: DUF1569 domain-containing protein [Bacteroidota bacterium]